MLRTGLFPSTFWDRDLWVVGITGSPISWKNIKYSIGTPEFEPIFSYDSVLHMMDWICCSGEWPACLAVFSPPLLCLFGYVLGFFVCVCGVFLEVFLWFHFFIYNFPKNTPAYIACKVQTSCKPQFYYITWNSVPASSGLGHIVAYPNMLNHFITWKNTARAGAEEPWLPHPNHCQVPLMANRPAITV